MPKLYDFIKENYPNLVSYMETHDPSVYQMQKRYPVAMPKIREAVEKFAKENNIDLDF